MKRHNPCALVLMTDQQSDAPTPAPASASSHGQLTSTQALRELVEATFPSEHFVYAFGYGSGVFSQTLTSLSTLSLDEKSSQSPGMLDMIFVVRHAPDFHEANQAQNPHHYATWLRTLDRFSTSTSGSFAANLQRRFLGGRDAKVLFHVIDYPVPLKYGVIQYEDFLNDLTQWESLYIAGRLHKPTLELPTVGHQQQLTNELQHALRTNLQAAVAAAMLLSPLQQQSPTTSSSSSSSSSIPTLIPWLDLYSQIAALSYTGDFRMQVGGEDPHKIQKLVQAPGQMNRFHALYGGMQESNNHAASNSDILGSMQESGLISIGTSGVEWDPLDVSARTQLIQRLPLAVKKPLLVPTTSTSRHQNSASNPVHNYLTQQQETLAQTLASIVAPAARYQSMKGILTFGLRNSVKYGSAKLAKGLFRKR